MFSRRFIVSEHRVLLIRERQAPPTKHLGSLELGSVAGTTPDQFLDAIVCEIKELLSALDGFSDGAS